MDSGITGLSVICIFILVKMIDRSLSLKIILNTDYYF
jgi:hypothetical protein